MVGASTCRHYGPQELELFLVALISACLPSLTLLMLSNLDQTLKPHLKQPFSSVTTASRKFSPFEKEEL